MNRKHYDEYSPGEELSSGYEPDYSGVTGGYGKPKKKKSVALRIMTIFLVVVLVFSLLGVGFYFLAVGTVPAKTNFLIMATDEEGTRTDTIMVVNYNKNSGEISVISVPRDTYVTVSDEMFSQMSEEFPQPGSKSMKINAVHHYMGSEKGPQALRTVIENMMGIKIDYYAKIDFDAFKYIIDSVGGIDFYVPCDMKYSDPVQNLYIDLKEGQQHLNGEQAEQVVRFRSGYVMGDLERVQVQQDFMKAFVSQTLSKSTILSHPDVFFNAAFKYDYIESDMSSYDILAYGMSAGGINAGKMKTSTLPGEASYAGGQSVYVVDEEKLSELVESLK